jgi:tetratricopeptide (TPR) repeat protein
MRKNNTVLYITLFLTILSLSHAQKDIPQLVEEIKPAVVTILTFDRENDTLTQGSGFFINAKGDIITNLHVLKGAYFARVKTADGKIYRIEYVLAENQDADLVLVSISLPVQKDFTFVDLATTIPVQGEHIVIFGSPFGLELSVSDGIVSAVRELPGFGSIIQLTAPISAGSSGGPVVNMRGEVVGIATLQVIEGQNLNFAVPTKFILELEPSKEDFLMSWTFNKYEKTLQMGDSLYDCAMTYFWIEDYEKALLHFQYTIEFYDKLKNDLMFYPTISYYDVLLYLGLCYREIGQREMAIWTFSKAISICPAIGEAYVRLANEYRELKRYAEAIYEYKRAIKVDTYYFHPYHHLGILYNELKMHNESIVICNQLINLNPDYVGAHRCLGDAYLMLGSYAMAAEEYEQAIRLDPNNDSLYSNVGIALFFAGKPVQAIMFLKQCIKINPDNIGAHYLLGTTFLAVDDMKAALDEYKILKELDPATANDLFESIYK